MSGGHARFSRWFEPRLRITSRGVGIGVGLGAQRPKIGLGIRYADERYRPGSVLAVKRSGLVHIENAPVNVRIIRIVEPESYVERVDWIRIALIRIEAKDLIEQDRSNCGRKLTITVRLKI